MMLQFPQKVLKAAESKAKGSVPGQTDCPMPEINSMAVMIDQFSTDGNYS